MTSFSTRTQHTRTWRDHGAQLQELGDFGRATAPDVIAEVEDPNTGQYNLTYNATFAGEYRLTIKVLENGAMLGIAADALVDYWEVTVFPAEPYAAKSTAVGLGSAPWDGLGQAMTGTVNQIQVDAYDRFGNRKTSGGDGTFYYTLSGGYPNASDFGGDLVDMDDGRHILTYNMSKSGPYHITISIFDTSLSGSPFYLAMIPQPPQSFGCIPRSSPLAGNTTVEIEGHFFDPHDFGSYLEWIGNTDISVRLEGNLDDGTRWGMDILENLVGSYNPSTGMIAFTTPPFPLPGYLRLEMKADGQDWTETSFQFQLYREASVFAIAMTWALISS